MEMPKESKAAFKEATALAQGRGVKSVKFAAAQYLTDVNASRLAERALSLEVLQSGKTPQVPTVPPLVSLNVRSYLRVCVCV